MTLTRVKKSLGTLLREALEAQGLPVDIIVDENPPACGAMRYRILGELLSPGDAAKRLGVEWP